MRAKKILIALLIINILIFYSTNSSAIFTIDDSAYVIAIGFDKSENQKITLSLQIAIPSSTSTGSDSSSQSESSIVKTIDCNSMHEGINLINSYVSKKLNLSYCKVVVFAENLPSKDIINYTTTLINDLEVRPYCNVVMSNTSAKDFLENSEPLLDKLSSKYYKIEEASENNTGYTEAITLLDFYNDYYDSFGDMHCSIGEITSDGHDKKHIENLGIACFHNGEFSGEITGDETIYHLMCTNKLKNTVISIPSPFNDTDYISLYIDDSKCESTSTIVNGFPYITCSVKISTRIYTSTPNSNYLSEENIYLIEEYANSYIKANLTNYLYKTSVVLKSDIDKFGRYAVKNFKTWNEWVNYKWTDKYESSTFKINVTTNLKSSYLILGTS